MPRGPNLCTINGLEPGSLLRLSKSIYGCNDAARAWYPALVEILLALGWRQLQFDDATFGCFAVNGDLIGLICLHMDMTFDMINHEKAVPALIEKLQGQVELTCRRLIVTSHWMTSQPGENPQRDYRYGYVHHQHGGPPPESRADQAG